MIRAPCQAALIHSTVTSFRSGLGIAMLTSRDDERRAALSNSSFRMHVIYLVGELADERDERDEREWPWRERKTWMKGVRSNHGLLRTTVNSKILSDFASCGTGCTVGWQGYPAHTHRESRNQRTVRPNVSDSERAGQVRLLRPATNSHDTARSRLSAANMKRGAGADMLWGGIDAGLGYDCFENVFVVLVLSGVQAYLVPR